MPYRNLNCSLDDYVPLQRIDDQRTAGGMCGYCGHHFAHKEEFDVHIMLVNLDAEKRQPPLVGGL